RKARERAELKEAAKEAASIVGRVFSHESCRAAVFAPGREPLHHPQDNEQGGRPETDAVIVGDQPDAERRAGHQQDRSSQHGLAAEAVSQRPPEQPAQWPDQEGYGEGRQREQDGLIGISRENSGGDVSHAIGIDAIVEPFGRIANGRRRDGPAQGGSVSLRLGGGGGHSNCPAIISSSFVFGSSREAIGVVRGRIWKSCWTPPGTGLDVACRQSPKISAPAAQSAMKRNSPPDL